MNRLILYNELRLEIKIISGGVKILTYLFEIYEINLQETFFFAKYFC